jgi:multiple sugar transport system permease protein
MTTNSTTRRDATGARGSGGGRLLRVLRFAVLLLGAFLALVPFYYMLLGALQKERDTSVLGLLPLPRNLTLDNFVGVNESIDLARSLLNSLIMTAGVVGCTLVFGLLVGYALSVLSFRGQGLVFALVLLVQAIPFQLLMIPLYVMVVRYFDLADNYLGMILPFAVNSVAVLIFRQYFLQIPRDVFDAARIDGASELRILRSIAVPLVRPAVPVAVPRDEGRVDATARGEPRQLLAGELVVPGEPDGRGPGGRVRPRGARRRPVPAVPAALHVREPRLGRQGLTRHHAGAARACAAPTS